MKKTVKNIAKSLAITLTLCILSGVFQLSAGAAAPDTQLRGESYQLWIGDTQVTDENCGAIPSVTRGSAAFDPATSTLTLDNVTDVRNETGDAVIFSRLSSLNIVLKGENRLSYLNYVESGDWYRNKGIAAYGSVSISDGGNGSLDLSGFPEAIAMKSSSLTIESGKLTAGIYGRTIDERTFDLIRGLFTCGSLTVNGGEIGINGHYIHPGTMPLEARDCVADCIYANSFLLKNGKVTLNSFEDGIVTGSSITVTGGTIEMTGGKGTGLYAINGNIDLSGTKTIVKIESSSVAAYSSKGTVVISDELQISIPENGYIGTYYGMPAIVSSDGSYATNVLIELKKCRVNVDLCGHGDTITVVTPYGTKFFDALNEAGVYEALDEMETDEYIFRDITTKPISDYADEEEYSDDAWALIEAPVTSDMTVYAGFYQKIKNVHITLDRPAAGTVVSGDWENQTNAPQITLSDGAHCTVMSAPCWETGEGIFEGVMQAGETYYTSVMLYPDFGYWLDYGTVVTAEGCEVVEADGRMALNVYLSVEPFIIGDANMDGKVDVRDVTAIQRHIAEYELLTGDGLKAADVNADGAVTIEDATELQEFLAEFEHSFPTAV